MPSSILVIEDEPAISELISVNLQHAGHCPIRAYNAEQAQNLISDVLPDLVLLDWMLPGKSGIAFARDLRNNERTKHIPIIMLTARGDAELISVNLQHAGHCPIRAYNAEQAQNLISDVLPDLVLLDWMLPGKSGIAFARDLRNNERTKHIPIIMLTARGDEQDKVLGLEIGADDYVTKPFSPKELMARIKAVLRRRAPQLTEDVVAINGLKLDPATHRVAAHAEGSEIKLDLGPTEFRLLHFFMTHPERVHSRTQLLDQVWGDHVFVEERTVDVHIKRLRAALKPAGCDAMIETVRGSGYRLAKSA